MERGFLSDSFVGVASLSQAGSERRVSHDAGVDVLAEYVSLRT